MPQYERGPSFMLVKPIAIAVTVLVVLTIGSCAFGPQYNVYKSRMRGEAMLAESLASKQVKVQEALAFKESAQSLADAEVIRATGVAKANKIIGDSLKDNDGYLRYLWITKLAESEHQGSQVIYVPTEAGLPILEANRLNKPATGASMEPSK